jgi:hypothetical protein
MGGGGGFELAGASPALVLMRFGGGGFELWLVVGAALLAPG